MNFDMNLVVNSFPLLLVGAGVTIQITVLSTAIGFVIGLIVGVARISHLRPLRMLAEVYVEFFRGTPLLVQIFLFYFALPVITGQRIDPFIAAISACGINSGAYVAETFRSAVAAIPRGQFEAAATLNFTRMQTLRHVVIPQAVRIALPNLGNNFIDLIKGTSLVSVISMVDLFQTGKQIASRTFEPLAMYSEVAVIYLVIFTLLTAAQSALEKYSNRYVRSNNA